MDDFNQSIGRAGLFIGQLIIIILCIAYIDFIYYTNILPDKQVDDSFEQTNCYIMSKRLATQGSILHSYRADFLVSYKTTNGVQYSNWVSGNGLDESFTENSSSQEAILAQYDIGSVYPCYYDPNNPQIAVLVLRHSWTSTLPLLVPAAIIIAVGYYLLKSLFQFMGTARVKTREVIRKKKEKKSQQQNLKK